MGHPGGHPDVSCAEPPNTAQSAPAPPRSETHLAATMKSVHLADDRFHDVAGVSRDDSSATKEVRASTCLWREAGRATDAAWGFAFVLSR